MGQSASPIPSNVTDWPPPLNIHEHISRCTCTCDHMGYGNYLDYQVSRVRTHILYVKSTAFLIHLSPLHFTKSSFIFRSLTATLLYLLKKC